MLTRMLAVAVAAAAMGVEAPPGALPSTPQPAPAVADEYDFVAAATCPCGGSYVAYNHFNDYAGDQVLDVVFTRCSQCREERLFYFDLTPRYGTLSEFRAAKLATRARPGPSPDNPCPDYASAVTVASIEEEYIFLETTSHSCGSFYVAGDQALANEGGHYYDLLTARCPGDGTTTTFTFNIDSFYGNAAAYPEMIHLGRQGNPPPPLPGRAPETAFAGTAEEIAAAFAAATHAADGGPLILINRTEWSSGGNNYEVRYTQCGSCGLPVVLYGRKE